MSASDKQVGGTHYRDLDIQPWEFMEATAPREQFIGYLRYTALSYLARAGHKGPALDDYRKAHHVLEKLIETIPETPAPGAVIETNY